MWQQWVNAILGLWVIAVPFLGFDASTMMWTLIVSGVAVAALGLWGAGREMNERTMHGRPQHG